MMLLCGKEKFRDGKDDHPYECSENGGMRKRKKKNKDWAGATCLISVYISE